MILGADRPAVVRHIRQLAAERKLNDKAELDDPNVSDEQKMQLVKDWQAHRASKAYKREHKMAAAVTDYYARAMNGKTEYVGLDKVKDITDGAIITHNHFNQLDSTVVTNFVRRKDKKSVYVVIEETNLALPGLFGFLMTNGNTIPITDNYDYMKKDFPDLLEEVLEGKDYVLIYPEQEMWFNYRKPRPCKRGAYYYAAKFNTPVISLFTEMIDKPSMDDENFHDVRYRVHVLDPIWPDPEKSVRINSIEMAKKDYEQRCKAYEEAYGKPLNYDPQDDDIAGFVWKTE